MRKKYFLCICFTLVSQVWAQNVAAIYAEDELILTSFGQGHPFKVSAGGTHNLRDRKDYYPDIGVTESVFIQSAGNGTSKTLRGLDIGDFDLSTKMLKLWFKLEEVQNIKDVSISVGNEKLQNFVTFSLLGNQGQKWLTEGDWVPLAFSWNPSAISKKKLQPGTTIEDLRKNITDVQIRLVDKGTGPASLHISRISAMEEPRTKYPNGLISLTFDDNWASQYLYAKPKLDQYHMAATAYVITGFLGTPNYMTLAQLQDLQASSKWEIACHAFDPVMHLTGYNKYPAEAVEKDMLKVKTWLSEHGFGFGADGKHGLAHFAYPKGEFKRAGETDVLAIARKHFISARTINEKHREVWPAADLHKLRVLYITGPKTPEAVIAEIERGKKAGEWMILVLHDLVEEHQRNDQWEISKFNQLMDYIGTQQGETPVRVVGDVISEMD